MDSLEVPADTSMTGQESHVGPSSVGSYNDHAVVQNDSGSVASNSLQGHSASVPQSPARSTVSVPASPANAPSMPAPTSTPNNPSSQFAQTSHNVDLLDASDAYAYPTSRQRSGGGVLSSDDDQTEPSSSATGNTGENPAGYTRSDWNSNATSTFGRLVENTKRRLNPNDKGTGNGKEDEDDDEEDVLKSALIYGYLKKLGRNGKWQTRWFETDGECLTYYKSSKRVKLLATLDLAKVGSIQINHEDEDGTTFTINISERPYQLQADSRAACKDWVIMLNRVKEARMQEGNVKLVMPPTAQPPDLLDQDFTPRVVVVANRQRTRAVDDEEIQSWEKGENWNPNPAADTNSNFISPPSKRLARWQKPRNSLARLASKLAKWARSIRKHSCADAENHVILDHHLHPPGHDDKKEVTDSSSGKKTTKDIASTEATAPGSHPTSSKVRQSLATEEDDDIRHLS